MITDKSQLLRPIPAAIPEEMKLARRWMGFVLVEKVKKDGTIEYTKEPRQGAHPSRKASSTNPATWCDFETAMAAVESGEVDGLGFALGDGWAGVDIDDAVVDREFQPKVFELEIGRAHV